MLTIEQVRESLRKAVALKGEDYIYPRFEAGCFYADPGDGTPSCIVGHVLADIAPEEFERLRKRERLMGTSSTAHEAIPKGLMPYVAILALDAAQADQDNSATWGQAMARFELTLGELNGNSTLYREVFDLDPRPLEENDDQADH